MEKRKYEIPKNVEDMKCLDYFDAAAKCWSPINYFKTYYRHGDFPDCAQVNSRLQFCLSIKLKSKEKAQIEVTKERMKELQNRRADHVWCFRTEAPVSLRPFFPDDFESSHLDEYLLDVKDIADS